MYYLENDYELKKFNTKDRMTLEFLGNKGIITGESRELIKNRA